MSLGVSCACAKQKSVKKARATSLDILCVLDVQQHTTQQHTNTNTTKMQKNKITNQSIDQP
eukprot:m.34302 g.34302  ORF g.34302 m.34302 type:complete len:61 (+) comp8704_c0_seq1:513-695(+)